MALVTVSANLNMESVCLRFESSPIAFSMLDNLSPVQYTCQNGA